MGTYDETEKCLVTPLVANQRANMNTQLTATGKGKAFNFDATVLEMDERSFDSRSSGSGRPESKNSDENEDEQTFPSLDEALNIHSSFDIN